jgi:hypothetical protein
MLSDCAHWVTNWKNFQAGCCKKHDTNVLAFLTLVKDVVCALEDVQQLEASACMAMIHVVVEDFETSKLKNPHALIDQVACEDFRHLCATACNWFLCG